MIAKIESFYRFGGPVCQSGCFFSSDSLRSQAYEKAIPTSPRALHDQASGFMCAVIKKPAGQARKLAAGGLNEQNQR